MIRTAFLGVFVLAGLLAFGAFFLARGSAPDLVDVTTHSPAPPPPSVDVPVLPEVEKLFFLRGIDLNVGEITLVLFDAGPSTAPMVVRDPAAIKAAQNVVYVNKQTTDSEATSSFVLTPLGSETSENFAQIYRDDMLIASISCTNTNCGSHVENPNINYGNLLSAALPLTQISDNFDSYDDYLATIKGIANDASYMLLHARPQDEFPAPRSMPTLTVQLPNVIVSAQSTFDAATYEALVSATIAPLLPEGATLDWIRIKAQGNAVLADKDNNQPVLVNGAEIPFLNVQFYDVRAQISGITTLPAATYELLTEATLNQYDIDRDFAAFVTGSLPTTCVDCYFLKVEGGITDTARADNMRDESYSLTYFDPRDAP